MNILVPIPLICFVVLELTIYTKGLIHLELKANTWKKNIYLTCHNLNMQIEWQNLGT
jgi:hypothetical protein